MDESFDRVSKFADKPMFFSVFVTEDRQAGSRRLSGYLISAKLILHADHLLGQDRCVRPILAVFAARSDQWPVWPARSVHRVAVLEQQQRSVRVAHRPQASLRLRETKGRPAYQRSRMEEPLAANVRLSDFVCGFLGHTDRGIFRRRPVDQRIDRYAFVDRFKEKVHKKSSYEPMSFFAQWKIWKAMKQRTALLEWRFKVVIISENFIWRFKGMKVNYEFELNIFTKQKNFCIFWEKQ